VIRAAEVVCASIPKIVPHISDCQALVPRPPIELTPSMLRSGMKANPEVQRVVDDPPAPAAVVVVPRIPKGSGEVVEDCFH